MPSPPDERALKNLVQTKFAHPDRITIQGVQSRVKPLTLAALLSLALSQAPATLTDPEAYAVYSALIATDSFVRGARPTELLIQGATDAGGTVRCAPSGPDLSGPWVEALTDLNAQRGKTELFERQFSLPVAYRFETRETLQSFFTAAGPGWDAFHAAYPKSRGFIRLSAVGFDRPHQHAIVHMAHSCGGLCGESAYHFLQRTTHGWDEVRLKVNPCLVVS